MEKRVPEKKARLLESLDKGMTMIHLDARRPGVLVPEHLKNELHLILNLSYRFDPPDLSVGEWGIRQTLTFQGRRFTVAIPWSALYAISSHVTHQFWMYSEDMPRELLEPPEGVTALGEATVPEVDAGSTPNPARAVLKEIVNNEPVVRKPESSEAPKRPSHLRLVK
jgi:stringent starvation protein B